MNKIIESGTYPLSIPLSCGKNLVNYKIYGNSVQSVTPAPDNASDLISVGEKTNNIWTLDKTVYAQTDGTTTTSVAGKFTLNSLENRPIVFSTTIKRFADDNVVAPHITVQISYTDATRTTAVNRIDYPAPGETKRVELKVTPDFGKLISGVTIWLFDYESMTYRNIMATDIQLEYGNAATAYEPFGYKIPITVNETTTNIYLNNPLRKIGEAEDLMDYARQKIVRKVGRYEVTGSELGWYDRELNYDDFGIVFRNETLLSLASSENVNPNVRSNYFPYGSISDGNDHAVFQTVDADKDIQFKITDEQISISKDDTPEERLTAFKEWLSGQYSAGAPITIYYELAEATEESFELPSIATEVGANTLEVATLPSPSKVSIEYEISRKVFVTEENLKNIAKAIRGRNGLSRLYKPYEMKSAIEEKTAEIIGLMDRSAKSFSLPPGTTNISSYVFNGCIHLEEITIPENVVSVKEYAFKDCSGMEKVSFLGTPDTVSSNAFYGCTQVTDVYVPWSSGEVANAPWGMTNATIHYNTQ